MNLAAGLDNLIAGCGRELSPGDLFRPFVSGHLFRPLVQD
jgi:hypothetical protein